MVKLLKSRPFSFPWHVWMHSSSHKVAIQVAENRIHNRFQHEEYLEFCLCWSVGQTKASWIPWYLPWSWDTDALDSQSGKGNAGLLASSISGAPCLGSRKVSCFGLLLRCNCSVGLLPYSILIALLPSFSFSCGARVHGYFKTWLAFSLEQGMILAF